MAFFPDLDNKDFYIGLGIGIGIGSLVSLVSVYFSRRMIVNSLIERLSPHGTGEHTEHLTKARAVLEDPRDAIDPVDIPSNWKNNGTIEQF